MWRYVVLLIVLSGGLTNRACGEPLVLRLETRGYLDAPADQPAPPEELLSFVEVLVSPGARFYGKAKAGDHTISIRGRFHQADKGRFTVEDLKFSHEQVVRDETGKPEKRPAKRTSFRAGVMIEVGKSCELGGESLVRNVDRPGETRSKKRDVLILKEYVEEREE